MKKLLLPFFIFLFPSSAFADITAKYVTSAQISIDSPYVITNAAPSSYSISGNNVTTSTGTGDSIVTNAGSAFSKTESVIMGDATPSTVTPSSGIAALPVLSGQTTIGSGGTAGSLALTSLSSGVHTCTAGGSGTSCIGSTKVTITID